MQHLSPEAHGIHKLYNSASSPISDVGEYYVLGGKISNLCVTPAKSCIVGNLSVNYSKHQVIVPQVSVDSTNVPNIFHVTDGAGIPIWVGSTRYSPKNTRDWYYDDNRKQLYDSSGTYSAIQFSETTLYRARDFNPFSGLGGNLYNN